MIRRLVLTVALAGLSGGAFAADLRGPIIDLPPPPPAPVAGFSWTGGYAGVNVGFGGGSTNYGYNVNGYAENYGQAYGQTYTYSDTNQTGGLGVPVDSCRTSQCYSPQGGAPTTYYPYSASGAERLRDSGVVGGVQVGYNYAITGFGGLGDIGGSGGYGHGGLSAVPVIGVEADFDGSGIHSGGALGQFAQGFPIGVSNYVGVQSNVDYFGTVRGRLGVAFDRLLVFGTGGFAYGETEASVSSPENGVYNHARNFHTGYAYGGGFEFALTNHLLLRAEYLHLELNNKAIVANGGNPTNVSYSFYEKPSLDIVRAGLDYKFDFARAVAPPVIARY